MKISAVTDIGMKRQSNQDAFVYGELPAGGFYAVVCDGMGGHAGGNVASKLATERIAGELSRNFRENMSASSVRNMIESAVVIANLDVFDAANEDKELAGMGTTVVAAVFTKDACVVANVGDSRCYKVSADSIQQITKDHSLVQEMVDAGFITAEEAEKHPRKNIITRALGIAEDIETDFFDVDISDGEKLLLCSDGLSNNASEDTILEIINNTDSAQCAQKLIDVANSNGGSDNITAAVVYK
ncbi:MAG: Stp1/IreP family PP2C-type Ser/Thr phosphatase [Clostridia bacterium]|nr:Stp1/IreP family PP2C-type Ser/Thr phosphatase [Clostridia bacterium]